MKNPNFFIIGAPKTGTTSLYKYLLEHPNVFMSEYLNLFKETNQNHIAVGEASVLYLFSKNAIKNIANDFPYSKLIVLLRNPVDVIQSWHAEMVWSRLEVNENLETAWKERIKVQKGGQINNSKLDYQNIARYGLQIKTLFKYFPKKQIKIIYYEDFSRFTKETYIEVINFLNIPYYDKIVFEPNNSYKIYKIKWLQKFLTNPPKFILTILKIIKNIFKENKIGLFKKLLILNTSNPKKPNLSNELKNVIIKNYYEDINNLSKILNKDLISLWFQFYNKDKAKI